MTVRRTHPRRVAAAAAALLCPAALAACQGGNAQTTTAEPTKATSMSGFENPVYAANFPDPQVIATEDGYLAIATKGNGMNVQTLTSKDMVRWDQGVDALPTLPKWSSSGKVWAPEIIRWTDGTWRLHYTTKGPDPQWQCVSVATSKYPQGPFVDTSSKPLVCESSEGGSIDQSPFIDSSGKAWLYWKNDGNAIGVDTWIRVQALDATGKAVIGKPTNLLQQDLPWEGHLVEAPAVVEVDGTFHMFYSGNDFGSDKYAVGHAVATSPTGPFTKDPEPVVVTNDVAAGPGHCQLLKVHGQWWMVYHAWEPGAVGDEATGRQMWLSKVTFAGRQATVEPPTRQHPQLP